MERRVNVRRKLAVCIILMLVLSLSNTKAYGYSINNVYVQDQMPSGKLNAGSKDLYVGDSYQLQLKGATAAEWRSNNTLAVTVSKTGRITAKKAGYANVVAVVSEDEVYVCTVSVKSAELSKTDTMMYKGKSQTLKLYGATAKSWKSSKPSVASVTSKGKITAKAKGATYITCTDTEGKTYKCQVTVFNAGAGSAGKSVAQVKKKLGSYEVNKVYVKGTKAFAYIATNGAFGNDQPTYEDIDFALRVKYPGCDTTSTMKTIYQYCDGISAMNFCDYSLYYVEYKVTSRSKEEASLHTIDPTVGDNPYNYLGDSEYDKENIHKISKSEFPGLYKYLYIYDLNGDGWLCQGELQYLTNMTIEDKIADLSGIEKLTNLYSICVSNYTGTSIVIPSSSSISSLDVSPNTAKLTINAPKVTSIRLHTYYKNTFDGMEPKNMSSVNLAKCKSVENLYVGLANCSVKVTLPSSADSLKELSVEGITNTSLDLRKYSKLEKFAVYYSSKICSVNLSSNKKLKEVAIFCCKKLSKSKVKVPSGKNVKFTIYG